MDVILDSIDGNYWKNMPGDEKDKLIDEFFKVYFKDADFSEEETEIGDVKEKKDDGRDGKDQGDVGMQDAAKEEEGAPSRGEMLFIADFLTL